MGRRRVRHRVAKGNDAAAGPRLRRAQRPRVGADGTGKAAAILFQLESGKEKPAERRRRFHAGGLAHLRSSRLAGTHAQGRLGSRLRAPRAPGEGDARRGDGSRHEAARARKPEPRGDRYLDSAGHGRRQAARLFPRENADHLRRRTGPAPRQGNPHRARGLHGRVRRRDGDNGAGDGAQEIRRGSKIRPGRGRRRGSADGDASVTTMAEETRILVTDPLAPQGMEIFERTPGFVVDLKVGIKPPEIKQIIKDYHGWVLRSGTKVTGDILETADNLKVIGRAGIGVENIDVAAASKRGIVVMNTPGGNNVTTGEHTISLMLSLARHIPQAVASLKSGKWTREKFTGVEVCNKTLGIIGLGNVGRIVAERAIGLRMKVLGYD